MESEKLTIGKLIEKEVRKQQIPITEFARLICCQRNNVYDIFKRSKIDIVQLKQISKVLRRNFFKELADDLELINEEEMSGADVKSKRQYHNSLRSYRIYCENWENRLQLSSVNWTILAMKIVLHQILDCPTIS